MKKNEIITVYIAYTLGKGGKRRPVLVAKLLGDSVFLYRITSKFQNKSNAIKAFYYPIVDWEKAGLRVQSYVDTGSLVEVSKDQLGLISQVGLLSGLDIEGLRMFLAAQ